MHQGFYVNGWWWWEEIELHIPHPYLILRCAISYMQALPCGTVQLKKPILAEGLKLLV